MAGGIRSTVAFSRPEGCPIAELSATEHATIHSVVTSVSPGGEHPTTAEFVLDRPVDDIDATAVSRLFTIGSLTVCRIAHHPGQDCPCICLGEFQTPVARYRAENGALTLVFHAADFTSLQEIVEAMRERYPSLDIRRLLRLPDRSSPQDTIMVHRGALTERQLRVLELAYARGYFERPRRTNATELAEELGISASTFGEHLTVALSKLLEDVLVEG